MLESLGIYKDMTLQVMKGLEEQIVQDVLNQYSLPDIVDNIASYLPEEPTTKQQAIIESSAHEIFSIQGPEVKNIKSTKNFIININMSNYINFSHT